MGVKAFEKASGVACSHCITGAGCSAYEIRPSECRTFNCAYLRGAPLGEEWRPADCGMVVAFNERTIMVRVDAASSALWRQDPFYAQIKAWAAQIVPNQGQVLVFEGDEAFAVLPDRDEALGSVTDEHVFLSSERAGAERKIYDVIAVAKDDPRAIASRRKMPG
jgi:hypothetical protein